MKQKVIYNQLIGGLGEALLPIEQQWEHVMNHTCT